MKAVVFDLFHTLIDPEEFRPAEFTRAGFSAEYFGLDPSRLKSAWDADTPRRATDGSRTMLTFLAEFCRAEGRPWPPPQDLDRYDREVGRYQDQALEHPVAGAVQLLTALRAAGFRTGLLSNAEERDCRRWAVSPLGPLFDVAHFSYDTGLLKPDLPAYQEILRRLDLAAGECAFVGDGGGGELAGARQAGFGLVIFLSGRMLAAVNSEERLRRVEAAHVTAAGFDEVLAALRRL
jgi:putative hydrolase of the HAD superfamily